MYAEEVYFRRFEGRRAHAQGDGNAGDEGDEFVGFSGADADVPFFAPAGGFEGPRVLFTFHSCGRGWVG